MNFHDPFVAVIADPYLLIAIAIAIDKDETAFIAVRSGQPFRWNRRRWR